MKFPRARTISLGLALFAGELRAIADDWQTPSATPALLPHELRPGQWAPAGSSTRVTEWHTAGSSVRAVKATPATPPPASPATTPQNNAMPAPLMSAGPRTQVDAIGGGPLPIIPTLPVSAPTPVQPLPMRSTTSSDLDWQPVASAPRLPRSDTTPRVIEDPRSKQPLPAPRPLPGTSDAKPMPKSADEATKVLPEEQPAVVPGSCELPTAPPELMLHYSRVPRNQSFSSAPVHLESDYPSFHELFGKQRQAGGAFATESGQSAIERIRFAGEYLLWKVNPAHTPVLATTTLAPGAIPSLAAGNGFLGDPATRVLIGSNAFGTGQRQGFRIRGGWWIDDCATCGLDASLFYLGRKSTPTQISSPGNPVITRPFFSPNTNPVTGQVIGETGEIVAFPNFATGTLSVQTTSLLWGADANIKKSLCRGCDYQAWAFAGYRFLNLSESLTITEYITSLPGNPMDPPGTRVVVQDAFRTQNWFNGGQVGIAGERDWGRFSLNGRASLALGATHQQIDINGYQIRVQPGSSTPSVYQGGLLAAGPNLGRFTRDAFSVVPEATLNFGYRITPNLKLYAGYNFIFWSNVVRPGDQIDRTIDVRFVPNPPPGIAASGQNRPQVPFAQSDLWVHGVQFGVQWRW